MGMDKNYCEFQEYLQQCQIRHIEQEAQKAEELAEKDARLAAVWDDVLREIRERLPEPLRPFTVIAYLPYLIRSGVVPSEESFASIMIEGAPLVQVYWKPERYKGRPGTLYPAAPFTVWYDPYISWEEYSEVYELAFHGEQEFSDLEAALVFAQEVAQHCKLLQAEIDLRNAGTEYRAAFWRAEQHFDGQQSPLTVAHTDFVAAQQLFLTALLENLTQLAAIYAAKPLESAG